MRSFDPLIGVEVAVCVLPQTMLGDSDPFYDCGRADMPFLPPPLLSHLPPPPNLEVPHSHLKSIWECPKINKVNVELENIKIQAGWRCGWCQSGDQMFKTAHATKALAHVLSLPRCDIRACKGNTSKLYMILYRDLYQQSALATKERNSLNGDMADSIHEMQDRTASDIQLSRHNQRLMNKMYVWYILIRHLFAFLFV
jgi:hypothetical protein